jgi:hypothetical protein
MQIYPARLTEVRDMAFPIGIDVQERYIFVIAGRTVSNAERAGFIVQITSALVIRRNW